MKKLFGLLAVFTLIFSATAAQAAPKPAKAAFINAQGESIGTAILTESPGGVLIQLNLSRLTPGVHAIHIHTVGQCDPPDFKTTGGHFNPTGKHHGLENPQGPHAGDLPSITVASDGTSHSSFRVSGVTLGEGPGSLFDADGSSLVIHAAPDDNKTDPAGNSGARIACGVITR